MRSWSRFLAALLLASAPLAGGVPAHAQPVPPSSCQLFPSDSIFNTDISHLPANVNSATWMANMTQHTLLHPDLGDTSQHYGIPINVAPPPSTGVTPNFVAYASESDYPAEGYPIDQNTRIEGGPGAPVDSDRHALVIDANRCKLYEIGNLQNFSNGQTPQANGGAVWSLNSDAMRPDTWTSSDAAGLPIAPLLLRPDEIQAGSVAHAIRFTTHCTANSYLWPASHRAGLCDATYPPMGARFRLSLSYDISGFGALTQVVLRAFQHYGLILADNGSDWYFQGTEDDWWSTPPGQTVVSDLKMVPASQFTAIDESSLRVAAGSYSTVPPLGSRSTVGATGGTPASRAGVTQSPVVAPGLRLARNPAPPEARAAAPAPIPPAAPVARTRWLLYE